MKSPSHPILSSAEAAHPMKAEIRRSKEIIASVHPSIKEHVKWNSPAFYFEGPMVPHDPKTYLRDVVVFHLRKPTEIMLIFPNGDALQDPGKIFTHQQSDSRRFCLFSNAAEIETSAPSLQKVIQSWIDKFAIHS